MCQYLLQWLFYQHQVHQQESDCSLFCVKEYASVLLISSSRPITGSSLPCLAISFKFFAYLFNALNSWLLCLRSNCFTFSQIFNCSYQSFFGKTCIFQQFCCCIIALYNCQAINVQVLQIHHRIVLTTAPARNTTLFASRLTDCAGSPVVFGNFADAIHPVCYQQD